MKPQCTTGSARAEPLGNGEQTDHRLRPGRREGFGRPAAPVEGLVGPPVPTIFAQLSWMQSVHNGVGERRAARERRADGPPASPRQERRVRRVRPSRRAAGRGWGTSRSDDILVRAGLLRLGEAPPAVGRPGWRCRPAERPVAHAGAHGRTGSRARSALVCPKTCQWQPETGIAVISVSLPDRHRGPLTLDF